MARLEILEGFDEVNFFILEEKTILGRSKGCTLCLPDNRISRWHARITREGGIYMIEDLKSANGTMVRGLKILHGVPVELRDGDEIRISSTRMIFRAEKDSLLASSVTATPAKKTLSTPTPAAAGPTKTVPKPLKAALEPRKASVAREFGNLSILMLPEDAEAPRPEVNASLDASLSMAAVDLRAAQTEKGLQEALKRLQAMCRISEHLGAVLDSRVLMQRIIEFIFDVFPYADRAFIMLRDKAS
ncbi:MAG: FHA domain-containing protein, partial [Planctomycetota bacterium]